MKSIMLSIQPKYCELIASGKKTIEVRKTAPKLETPFKCYIYCTKGKEHLITVFHKGEKVFCDDANSPIFDKTIIVKSPTYFLNNPFWRQKVIGEFVCDRIESVNAQCSDMGIDLFYDDCKKYGCLSQVEVEKYFGVYDEERTKDLRDMKGNGYAWHITDLKIYDKPKELSEFRKPCDKGDLPCPICPKSDWVNMRCNNTLTRPPQSWCYAEEI